MEASIRERSMYVWHLHAYFACAHVDFQTSIIVPFGLSFSVCLVRLSSFARGGEIDADNKK